MANKKQRIKNRETSKMLTMKLPPKLTCPECGLKTRTGHFVNSVGNTYAGFYICPKYYDQHGKRVTI